MKTILTSKTTLFVLSLIVTLTSVVCIVELLEAERNQYMQMTYAFTYMMIMIGFIASVCKRF